MDYNREKLMKILNKHMVPGEEIKLIISRDGLHLANDGLAEDEEDTFSAMCATMYGAGETALYATDHGVPDHIELISNSTRLFLTDAGENILIAAMVSSDARKEDVLSALARIAKEVRKIENS